jgi:hypothetical protein
MFSFLNPIARVIIAPITRTSTFIATPISKSPERNNAMSLNTNNANQAEQARIYADKIRQTALAQAQKFAKTQQQQQAIANATALSNAKFEEEANKAKIEADKKSMADEKAKSDANTVLKLSGSSSSLLDNLLGTTTDTIDINSGSSGGGGGGGIPLNNNPPVSNLSLEPKKEPISNWMIAGGVATLMIGGYYIMNKKKRR